MYGEVTYVSRSEYANRKVMLKKYAESIAQSGSIVWMEGLQSTDFNADCFQKDASTSPSRRVAIVKEGASDGIALLGTVHLYLIYFWLLHWAYSWHFGFYRSSKDVALWTFCQYFVYNLQFGFVGLIRLVHYLAQPCCFGSNDELQLVVDSGTGTTAVGLAIGVILLRYLWILIFFFQCFVIFQYRCMWELWYIGRMVLDCKGAE